jgi:hypothetical protein
MRWRGIER